MATRSTLRFFLQRLCRLSQAALVPLVLFAVCNAASPANNDKPVPASQATPPASPSRPSSPPDLSAANQMLQRQGPLFLENRGQFDSRVKFLVTGNGANLWLTNEGIVFDFQRPASKQSGTAAEEKPASLKRLPLGRGTSDPRQKSDPPSMERLVFMQKLVSGNPNPTIEARDPQPGIYNYFPTSDPDTWRTHVLAYKGVVYRDIWKGIDLKLFANGPNLEEEFIVHPGADATAVRLAYEGINGLSIADDGSLKVATAFGDIGETTPRIYQEIAGKPVPLSGSFKVGAQNSYTFEVAKRDEKADLIIDPTVVYSKPRDSKKAPSGNPPLYSSFLGGSQYDIGNAIAVDNAGNAYITGQTNSTDFPTMGAYQGSGTGVFITKVNALGSQKVYSTYLGQGAFGFGIAVDSSGSAYVVGGHTNSNFPTTANAYDQAPCGAFDEGNTAFFSKLSPAGDALIYSTCLGQGPTAYAVAVDAAGNAYLTGANVFQGSLPTTPGAYQPSDDPNTQAPAFLSVINPSASGASSLVYSTYFGGTPQDAFFGDRGLGVAVDAYGMAYITGWTTSGDFPVTAGAYLTVYPGKSCCYGCGCFPGLGGATLPSAFIAKFDPQASGAASLIYSTFLGGSLGTIGYGLAVDSLGNAYVTGSTGGYYGGVAGQPVPFPTTTGAYQIVPDNNDAFVTKLNAAGNNLIYSTLLGGSGGPAQQWATGCALDASNDAYVTGWTNASNFPPAGNAYLPTDPNPAFQQGFVTQFNSTGTGLIYSSYLGGTLQATNGDGGGIAVDQVGDAYVTGSTYAIDFPVTSFVFQPSYAGNGDAFVTKFPIGTTDGISITGITPNTGGNAGQVTPEIVGTGFHFGATTQLNCGGNQIPGTNVTISADGRILQATFDLTGAAPGVCDVVVTDPDQISARLPQGFTVQDGGAADVRVAIAQTGAVPGLNSTYIITVSNVGNIDLEDFSIDNFIEPWFAYQTASPLPSEVVQGPVGWPENLVGSGQTYAMFLFWSIPTLPAQSSLPLSGTATLSSTFPIHTLVTQRACPTLDAGGRNCELDILQPCVSNAYESCKGDPDYAGCVESNLDVCYAPYEASLTSKKNNLTEAQPQDGSDFDVWISGFTYTVRGNDPNDLTGFLGSGLQQWVAGSVPLGYVLEFSNDGDAAVQRVVTTNPLNTAVVNTNTLRLATMIVVGHQVPIPPIFAPQAGLDQFDTNLDLRPAQNLFVQIHVSLDPRTGLITWVFQSIDPTTGLPPIDPTIGFLAPGASATLFFTVNPKPALPTGTQITDQATVVFDLNPPVSTQPWTNTLDNTPPTSQVMPLPGTELCTNFNVQWSGTDLGSGIANYTIYVSDNGRAFTAWQTNTTATSAVYNGQVGHSYGFYSIAQDLVGNIEPGKSSAEATTQVNKGTICGPVGPPTVLGGR
jgi:Beta-propeller repeat